MQFDFFYTLVIKILSSTHCENRKTVNDNTRIAVKILLKLLKSGIKTQEVSGWCG